MTAAAQPQRPPDDRRTRPPGGEGENRRPAGDRVSRAVERKATRKIEARSRPDRSVWFGLGMLGLVGWSVAVPTLIGVGIGLWLDSKLSDGVSWTLTLLLVGVALGCLNAWYWVKRASRNRHG